MKRHYGLQSTWKIRELHIPKKKLIPGTKESLDADEFLALCSYLQINPQTIPIRQGEK